MDQSLEAEAFRETHTFCIFVVWATFMSLAFFVLIASEDAKDLADRHYCETFGLEITTITNPDNTQHDICRGRDGRLHGSWS